MKFTHSLKQHSTEFTHSLRKKQQNFSVSSTLHPPPPPPVGTCGLRVRMGMHSGQLKRIRIPGEGMADYYGESANLAARVMSAAVGGQAVGLLRTGTERR
jgi:hypothetical protein